MTGSNGKLFSMPKGLTGFVGDEHMLSGISSFAFQGTNAHLLMGVARVSSAPSSRAGPGVVWQAQYISVLPPAHPQINACRVAPAIRSAVFEMQMGHPHNAYLCGHVVSGKIIFPGMCLHPFILLPARVTAAQVYALNKIAISSLSVIILIIRNNNNSYRFYVPHKLMPPELA